MFMFKDLATFWTSYAHYILCSTYLLPSPMRYTRVTSNHSYTNIQHTPIPFAIRPGHIHTLNGGSKKLQLFSFWLKWVHKSETIVNKHRAWSFAPYNKNQNYQSGFPFATQAESFNFFFFVYYRIIDGYRIMMIIESRWSCP